MSVILRFLILNLLRLQDAWTADRRTETKEERKRTRTTKRYTGNIIAQTRWKKLLQKFFSWTLNRLLFLRMSYFKWMHISKKWFSRFFLCSGMNFCSQLELNNSHLYSFCIGNHMRPSTIKD